MTSVPVSTLKLWVREGTLPPAATGYGNDEAHDFDENNVAQVYAILRVRESGSAMAVLPASCSGRSRKFGRGSALSGYRSSRCPSPGSVSSVLGGQVTCRCAGGPRIPR